MLHNCRAVTKQDSASGTHCDLRRRRWWYKRSCWNLVNFQFGDFRVKPYPVILVIYMELASSYEDECSTPSGSTQMATKIPSKAFQRVGNKSIQMTQLRLFTSPNFGFHSSFLAKTQSDLNIKVGLYGYHVGVIWFGSGVTSLVLLWFSDCFSVPISNETSWNLMKFVLAGLLIKWQWGNNDGNMVLYTSFESVLQKHPDVRCVGMFFSCALGLNQAVIPQIQIERGKEDKQNPRFHVNWYLQLCYCLSLWLQHRRCFHSGWQKVTCWSLGSSKHQFERSCWHL